MPKRRETFVFAHFNMNMLPRLVEQAPLLSEPDQAALRELAADWNLPDRMRQQIPAPSSDKHLGVLTLEEARKVADRYGIWCVRERYDWGPRSLRKQAVSVRECDKQLRNGIILLDSTLRRELEAFVIRCGPVDPAEVTKLEAQPVVDGRAAEARYLRSRIMDASDLLEAWLNIPPTLPASVEYWQEFARHYDDIRGGLAVASGGSVAAKASASSRTSWTASVTRANDQCGTRRP